MEKNNTKLACVILGALFFLNILAWIVVFDLNKPRFLEVHFFDVGQGDAIFIETPQRHQILIDGGPSSKILEKLGKNMPFWDKSIDLIILTHPERDHMAGLIEVFKKYKVENILWTGIIRDTAEYEEWNDLIVKEKASIFIARAEQRIVARRIVLRILYPMKSLEGQEFKSSNDTSVVSQLQYGQNTFLFTGDIPKSVEKKLVGSFNINSEVLKVAHHGSKTSTSEEFLREVLPEIAIIQVGENKYGHPHPEVLKILEDSGISVKRTDQQGDIKIFSDGENLKLQFSNSNFK